MTETRNNDEKKSKMTKKLRKKLWKIDKWQQKNFKGLMAVN